MKKYFYTLLLSTLSIAAVAQTPLSIKNYGVKAGINLSNNSYELSRGEYVSDNRARIAYHAGVFVQLGITEKIAVQPELLYSAQGNRWTDTENSRNAVTAINYLNLPVMVQYEVTDRLLLEAGPQVGYLLSAKYKWEDTAEFVLNSDFVNLIVPAGGGGGNELTVGGGSRESNDVKPYFNDIDLALGIGASYRVNGRLRACIRYTHGLMNVDNNERSSEINTVMKQRVTMVGLSYAF